jgi:hypothetical protein
MEIYCAQYTHRGLPLDMSGAVRIPVNMHVTKIMYGLKQGLSWDWKAVGVYQLISRGRFSVFLPHFQKWFLLYYETLNTMLMIFYVWLKHVPC